jgi:tetratricopeptide (TPR) repeat protein
MNFLSIFRSKTSPTAADFFESGFRWFKNNRYEDAKTEFRRALELDSSHRQSLICLGQILQSQADDRAAITLYEKAISAGANDSELFFLLGCAYGCVDDFDKSGRAFERALEINPENEKAREALATLQAKRRWDKEVQPAIPVQVFKANDPRSAGIGVLAGSFLQHHSMWIAAKIPTPERDLIAQIPITLAGAFQDALDAGLSPDQFFTLVRSYIAAANDLALEKATVEASLKNNPIGSTRVENAMLRDFNERVWNTLHTAKSSGLSLARWMSVWQEILPKFEATARKTRTT